MFSIYNALFPEKPIETVSTININVLGKDYKVSVDQVSPETSLNDYLRNVLFLKGTKHMCLEGGCGTCVVVARRTDPETKKEQIFALNSCLVPVLACNEWKIETIDGIGGGTKDYHAVQKVLADFNGTQCGYCSPGMVMNMYALYESGEVTMAEVENSFGGNICRCTGYRPILAAFKSLCKDADKDLLGTYPDIEDLKICRSKEGCQKTCSEPCSTKREAFSMVWEKARWIKVFEFGDLVKELGSVGDARYILICGNTGQGVYRIKEKPSIYIDVKDIPELTTHELATDKLILGGNVSLTYTMNLFYKTASENPKFSYLKELADHIDLIANVPVRNMGSLAGNLMLKNEHNEFPSDIFLIFETVGAKLTIVDTSGTETSLSLHDFPKTDMKLKILKNITLPALDNTYKYESYKIMPRAQNAHARVNAGFLFKFKEGIVESASIVYGAINPKFIHASNTESFLVGKNLFDNTVLQEAYLILAAELDPDVMPPEPGPEFRRQLAIALFYKAVLSMAPPNLISPMNKSGAEKLLRPVSSGTQDFETKQSLYPLTQAIPKIEALAQTSGQAEYVDDIPNHPNQLFARFVVANAPPSSEIKNIDASKALEHPDVVAFYSKDDIPGENNFLSKDMDMPIVEEIFCSGVVQYYSQPVGVIIAKTQEALLEAIELVEIEYTPAKNKPLLTVAEILEANAQDKIKPVQTIEAKSKGTDVKHVVKGVFEVGLQYHFHMETQACRVIPTEDGLDLYTTTQWMALNASAVAKMLNISDNKVNVTVRRCGGAFGAKISRNSLLSCACALAAWKLKKPVAMIMLMEDNFDIIGKRYPLYCSYEASVNDVGVIQHMTSSLYSDYAQGGNEPPGGELVDLFMSNYNSDVFDLKFFSTNTDLPANTWCRAPGSTEGLAAIESIMEHISYDLNLDPLEVRIANITTTKELLNYISDIKEWASIDSRKKEIEDFNKENRWKKKGLAVVPMLYKFHVFGPFTVYVTIYQTDGSVSVGHGGIEIGQGINTKAAQVCAYKLGIPLDMVSIRPSNSFVTPNCTSTGGSITSEAISFGICKACDELLKRLEPYKKPTWKETIQNASDNLVVLSAVGYYSPNEPGVQGYNIYGVCAAEVEVDILTGQHLTTRVDLIEDAGQSMSPLVDIGQLEGAFVMGMGYYTSEKMVFDENGKLLTNRTWTYKPPGAKDIPVDFRIKIPKNNPNPVGVLKSKATAEPPLCLSVSVPLAIRNAVGSARQNADRSQPKWYPMDGPSTVEQTFMQSLNQSTQYVL